MSFRYNVTCVEASMRPGKLESFVRPRYLLHLSWLALVIYGGLFIYIACRHVLYPGFTEPMEGDILYSIERAAHGLPLYPRLDAQTITLNYMPLYYFVCVPFYYLFGDSLVGPHLVSSFCTLASGALLGWMAWREARSRTIACLAAALYFSSYRIMDGFWTSAVPDSLLLFWLLLGFCFLAYGTKGWHDAVSVLCYTLAFWTKQQGAIYFGFAVLYALILRPQYKLGTKRLPRGAFVLGLLLGGPVAYKLLGPLLGEKFFYYTLIVPARWDHSLSGSLQRTSFVLLCYAPLASLLSLLYVRPPVLSLRGLHEKLAVPSVWLMLTALASAVLTMSSTGSSNNHYVPFLSGLCVTAALGVNELLTKEKPPHFGLWLAVTALLVAVGMSLGTRVFDIPYTPRFVKVTVVLVCITCAWLAVSVATQPRSQALIATVLLLGHFAITAYYPPNYLPDPGYREGIERLRAELQKLDGPVIWPTYGDVPPALTGRKLERAPSWVALDDIERQRAPREEIAQDLVGLHARIHNAQKLYMLSDAPLEDVLGWKAVAGDMMLLRDYGDEFSTVRQIAVHWYSGRSYPRYLYVRRPAAP